MTIFNGEDNDLEFGEALVAMAEAIPWRDERHRDAVVRAIRDEYNLYAPEPEPAADQGSELEALKAQLAQLSGVLAGLVPATLPAAGAVTAQGQWAAAPPFTAPALFQSPGAAPAAVPPPPPVAPQAETVAELQAKLAQALAAQKQGQ